MALLIVGQHHLTTVMNLKGGTLRQYFGAKDKTINSMPLFVS